MLLGGKGANLCEMANLGLPVPPAFVITTETCHEYFKEATGDLPEALHYEAQLKVLEDGTGKKFGDTGGNALLVSVRSGAPASMPGAWACVFMNKTYRIVVRATCTCWYEIMPSPIGR